MQYLDGFTLDGAAIKHQVPKEKPSHLLLHPSFRNPLLGSMTLLLVKLEVLQKLIAILFHPRFRLLVQELHLLVRNLKVGLQGGVGKAELAAAIVPVCRLVCGEPHKMGQELCRAAISARRTIWMSVEIGISTPLALLFRFTGDDVPGVGPQCVVFWKVSEHPGLIVV